MLSGLSPLEQDGWAVLLFETGCSCTWNARRVSFWNKFGERAEVLGASSKEELVPNAGEALCSQPVERQDPLEVGERHLDLLASAAGLQVRVCILEASNDITRSFVQASQRLALRLVETAFRFASAVSAFELAGTIGPGVGSCDSAALSFEVASVLLQEFAARAGAAVQGWTKGESRAVKGAVIPLAFLQRRHMRLDRLLLDNTGQEQTMN